MTITLPLPMSVNRMYMYNRYTHQKIYKREAIQWLETCELIVSSAMKGHDPIDDYTPVYFDFVLPRRSADTHNYLKLTCDALERGGFTTNDKYIMVNTSSVTFDTKNPHVVISRR